MPDAENLKKVKKALECCAKKVCIYKDTEKKCPYWELCGEYEGSFEDCTTALSKDALALLKAQEPRMMSLEEVLNAENTAEPLWCEFIDCAHGSWRMGWKLKTKGKREVQHIFENPLERAIVWESQYEKGWRCWTSRPTNEQREATPWQ